MDLDSDGSLNNKNNSELKIGEKFKYIFDDNSGIMYKQYIGEITLQDIFSSWDHAINNHLIPKEVKGFILDYQNAAIIINVKNYGKIPAYYKKHLEIFRNHKIAIVVENSKDIVIPSLVKTKDKDYISHPFTTLEGAIDWILFDKLCY